MLNEKEKIILQFIKANPYITQQELAERLSLSRSGVAGYISNLMKKGVIKGRAYVLNEEKTILCIGGMNIDRKARLKTDFLWKDSNPVTVSETMGGVARNIAENLARLNVKTSLLTVVGIHHDRSILSLVQERIDVSPSIELANERTGTYTAILDENGEMQFALADMDIYEAVTVEMLKDKWTQILAASYVVLDTNFPQDVNEEIVRKVKENGGKIIVVPVSSKKMNRLPKSLENIDYFICNEEELYTVATMINIKEKSLHDTMLEVMKQGIKNLVVTSGEKGVTYFSENGEQGELPAMKVEVVDVTGAGDSLSSGIIYGIQQGEALRTACQMGIAAASITLQTELTVSDHLSEEAIMEKIARM